MTPTKEQIRKFWEKCGFKYLAIQSFNNKTQEWYPDPRSGYFWEYPDGSEDLEPLPIDLNNLFKWAVPKMDSEMPNFYKFFHEKGNLLGEVEWSVIISTPNGSISNRNEDLTLALFWALYEALEVEK